MPSDHDNAFSRDVASLDEAARQALATPDLNELSEVAIAFVTIKSWLGSRMRRRSHVATTLTTARPLRASPPLPLIVLARRVRQR
jgi:hypothetical protein